MHLSFSNLVTVTLVALSGTAAGLGMLSTRFQRELDLAARMGISLDGLLSHGGSVYKTGMERVHYHNYTAEWVTLPIDHDDLSVGTYQNRYWVGDQYYRPGGPVFVFDVGESNAESTAAAYLTPNKTSFASEMLQEFNGMGIVWEHRYYGKSLPFPVSNSTPPEHFKYLTNKQALADIPFFAKQFIYKGYPYIDLTPDSTPWVMVGGSYSGMRSAFTRNEYPETIYAAFASSAPVEARIDMSIYFDQVYRGMVANGYLNCTRDLQAALQYIDGELTRSAESAAAIKQQFFGPGAELNSNGDFTAALSGVYMFFQAYGLGGGDGSLGSLCQYLDTDPSTNLTAGPEGFAPTRGSEYVAERFASWPIYMKLVNYNYNTNCSKQANQTQPASCVLNPASTDPDTISWTWQFCTEWGYFQSDNLGPHSLLSTFQSLGYMQYTCYRQFPEGVRSGLLPNQPQASATNSETGGWTIRPSNVYWSGGQFDPWRTLSPLSTEDFAPQGVNFTTEIPQCGVQTAEDELFGYIMPNAEHCFDMILSFAPGSTSRGYFQEALKEWLSCFKPRNRGDWATGFGVVPGWTHKS